MNIFQNAGNTLRQGIEANVTYKRDRWNIYANYTYVDATFRNALTLSSPFNPFADANGNIFVVPGDHLTGIPDFRFKLGAEYQITKPWKFGADLNVIGSQWLVGDESNQNPKVPAYWVVNLHSSYKISDHVELFGLVRNLFDQHYYIYGTFFDTTSFPYLNLTDPRTFFPACPSPPMWACAGRWLLRGQPFPGAPPPNRVENVAENWTAATSPAFSWTGLYLGINAAYSFGGSDWTDSVTGGSTGNFGTSGFLFGGTAGANYQIGRVRFWRRGRRRLDRSRRLRHLHGYQSVRRRLPDPQQLARHGARPRGLCIRPVLRLRHRRRSLRQCASQFLQRPRQQHDRTRLDGWRRRRGRPRRELDG